MTKPTFFETQAAFRAWLAHHYQDETELLVGFYKKGSGKRSMTWPESVDQALCFGWIDGVRKSIDDESYSIRFTPRKANSIWSAINIKKVEVLINAGLMTPAGLHAFSLRTEARSKIYAYEKDDVHLEPGFEEKFKNNMPAWRFFMVQASSYKRTVIHWIMQAKQEKTRLSRLEKTIQESEQQRRLL